jgi:hypothetical protein
MDAKPQPVNAAPGPGIAPAIAGSPPSDARRSNARDDVGELLARQRRAVETVERSTQTLRFWDVVFAKAGATLKGR